MKGFQSLQFSSQVLIHVLIWILRLEEKEAMAQAEEVVLSRLELDHKIIRLINNQAEEVEIWVTHNNLS